MRKFLGWVFGILLALVIIALAGLILLRMTKGQDATVDIVSRLTDGKLDVSELVDTVDTGNDIDKLKDTFKGLGEKTLEIKDNAISLAETVKDALQSTDYDIEDMMLFDRDREISEDQGEHRYDFNGAGAIVVEVGGCSVNIAKGPDEAVIVKSSEGAQFQCYEDNGCFCIKALSISEVQDKTTLDIVIPESFNGDMNIDVGSGSLRLEDLTVGQLAAVVEGGSISGAIKIQYVAQLICSVGSIDLSLAGEYTDYNYEVTAIGNINLNGTDYRGSVNKEIIDNGSLKRIVMTSNLGNIKIVFEDQ